MNHTKSDTAVGLPISAESRSVVILVYDGVKLLDVSGPAEVFAEANRLGANYRVSLVSPAGTDVMTSVGIRLSVDAAPESKQGADTVLIAGGDLYPRTTVPTRLTDAALTLAESTRRLASICTGAFILAAAGLLEGKRATTHWKVAESLASRYPRTTVDLDAIYVRDGRVYTSAGVSAGIDLALALVEEDYGAGLSRDVARALVVYLQRAGGQSQFSAPLQGSPPRTPALRRVVDLVMTDPTASHTLTELARELNLSARHLNRLFREELSTTPAKYVESIRFDIARSLLEQGYTATQSAERAGFPSYESLRRLFTRKLGISPAAYQHRFRTGNGTQRRSETTVADE
jgi:transcriptional regulator GlxA family with amidase domain